MEWNMKRNEVERNVMSRNEIENVIERKGIQNGMECGMEGNVEWNMEQKGIWNGMQQNGMQRNGMERNEMKWNVEWTVMEYRMENKWNGLE